MACTPCERARLARLAKLGKMAKKRKASGKRKTTRRRRVGGMGGKLTNRTLSMNLFDLLYIAGGAALNYIAVNPLLNKLTASLKKADGTPMLGARQGEILTALKGGAAAYAAYGTKMPKEAKLALLGVTAASGIELAGQLMPDKMVALSGTGDLFMAGIGNTTLLEIPMRRKGISGGLYDDVSIAGIDDYQVEVASTGNLFESADDTDFGF